MCQDSIGTCSGTPSPWSLKLPLCKLINTLLGGKGGGLVEKGLPYTFVGTKTTDLLQCSDIYFVILVLCVVSWRIALSSTRVLCQTRLLALPYSCRHAGARLDQ